MLEMRQSNTVNSGHAQWAIFRIVGLPTTPANIALLLGHMKKWLLLPR